MDSIRTQNLGYPRIGEKRELKRALEAFWRGQLTKDALVEQAKKLRAHNWQKQKQAGIDLIPSNDFSLYDHVLDMCSARSRSAAIQVGDRLSRSRHVLQHGAGRADDRWICGCCNGDDEMVRH